jgi:hypothetical protein
MKTNTTLSLSVDNIEWVRRTAERLGTSRSGLVDKMLSAAREDADGN